MREEALLANRERDTLKEELEKMRQTLEERDAEIRDLNEDKRKIDAARFKRRLNQSASSLRN